MLAPNFTRSTLTEAAHQLASHIRYTQHLAMMDNKFDPNDQFWYKKRWQIQFGHTEGSDNQWAYTIFSDHAGSSTGVADISEIAKNILNPQSQYMTGGYTANILPYIMSGTVNSKITKEMNLGHSYGISNVRRGLNRGISMSGGCNNVSNRIAFDNIGRPLTGAINSLTSPYSRNGTSRLLSIPCDIRLLTNDGESIVIRVEPETGYIHIL